MTNEELEELKAKQREDFKIIATRANKDCPICFGKGFQGFDINELKYIPCICVIRNLEKEVANKMKSDSEQGGIIKVVRQMVGLN